MTKRSLFDIQADLQAFDDLLYETGGDITDPSVAEAVEKWEAELARDIDAKADGWCAWITEAKAEAKAIKEESQRLAAKAKTRENTASGLTGLLKRVLESIGRKEAGTIRKAKIQGNGGKQPMALADGVTPESVPDRFAKITRSIDTAALREALESGDPEAAKYASLLPRGTRLAIR